MKQFNEESRRGSEEQERHADCYYNNCTSSIIRLFAILSSLMRSHHLYHRPV